ncbi:MAG: amidohydrolase family protein [Spirochaetota bacterium]
MSKTFDEIFEYVCAQEIIDTHEHLPHREDLREKNTDVLKEYLTHYFNRDLISAGLSVKDYQTVIDPKLPLMQRWELVEPYWKRARFTGYGRALDLSVKALYDIDGINRTTIARLNDEFLATLKGGQYARVLKEKSRIRISLLDAHLECDQAYFRSVYRPDNFIYPTSANDVRQISDESGISICCFDDWLEACVVMLDRAFKQGAVALKCGLAYVRSLCFERVTRNTAEEAFNAVLKAKIFPDWESRLYAIDKPLQDYMMHFILQHANRRGYTIQFHTGLQEGSGNYITHSDPALLTNLFLEYPNVKFDLFHIGYPYQQVLSVLAKTFPNVFIDMCWAHIISPTACIQALVEWLDAVPCNKICAFGGDYAFIDGVYGHQYLARFNVSTSLARKVSEGVFDVETAKQVAGMLFLDNPVKLFGL